MTCSSSHCTHLDDNNGFLNHIGDLGLNQFQQSRHTPLGMSLDCSTSNYIAREREREREVELLTSTLMAQRPMARTDLRTKSTSTSVEYLRKDHNESTST